MANSSTRTVVIVIVAVVAVVVIGAAACCVASMMGLFTALGAARETQTYQQSLAVIQTHPEAIQRLGQPIEGGMATSYNVHVTNQITTTEITYSVSGPQGSATVQVATTHDGTTLNFTRFDVDFDDGTRLDLRDATRDRID